MPKTQKTCKVCHKVKPVSSFEIRLIRKSGWKKYKNSCRICENKRFRDRYRDEDVRRSKIKERKRNYYYKRISSEPSQNSMFRRCRQRAKEKNIPFDLTPEDIVIPDVCPILGIPLIFRSNGNSPSIDRLIPHLGYTKGNISIISQRANTIKSFGTEEEHRKIANWIKEKLSNP